MVSSTKANEEDTFELVDHTSSDGDSVSNLSYVEVHNEQEAKTVRKEATQQPASASSNGSAAVRSAAPAFKVELHDSLIVPAITNKKHQDSERQLTVEAGIKTEKEGSKLPAPRLIRIDLDDDETDCGIGVYRRSSVYDYAFVGTLKKGSAADRAGVAIGDRICIVNGVATKGLKTAGVVDLLIGAGKSFDLLILQDQAGGMYSELDIPVSLAMPNIVRGAAPAAVEPYTIPLERRTATAEYDFTTYLLDRTMIRSVDANSAEYRAGLRK
ncbi:hypothetical protein PFISCL1PPCAC_9017 [Pristionchus fissidentatus]|uniref:PDZ domain-containing protein n=1 Tax=Pristionchus fissidentatus TaxID=1538716 RepID=A0AAV5VDH3_9BILA|nr:hypothetical protein PFISCL1PPCAC_9017 [Pristionchus fissidentatus]